MTLSQKAVGAAARAIIERTKITSLDDADGIASLVIEAALAVDGLCLVNVAMLRDMHEALEQTEDWHVPNTENWILYEEIRSLIDAAASDGEEK